MSRRIVRCDTSSSLASCWELSRPRAWSRPSRLTRRLARTGQRYSGIKTGDVMYRLTQSPASFAKGEHRMTSSTTAGSGTADDPWILATPPGKSDFEAWRDQDSDPPALVVHVGTTQLRYQLRCIDDLHAMLKERGDWVPPGNTDEQKAAPDGTVR